MKNKKFLGIAMMMASMFNGGPMFGSKKDLTLEDSMEIDRRVDKRMKDVKLKKGLKKFNIEGEEIIALNEKNAIRKYNLKKLQK